MNGAGPAGAEKGSRILYIDNIRIFLICLVITTHCSVTYGGNGSWFFTDPGNAPGVSVVLTAINALNQSFFMGFFILVSAYFIPGSLQRKGRSRFASDRLIRLGIPLLVWILFIYPLIGYIVTAGTGHDPGSPLAFWVSCFVPYHGIQLGPMWFVVFLLFSTFAYLAWDTSRPPAGPAPKGPRPFPSFTAIVACGLLIGAVTAAVRIFLPIGSEWWFGFQFPFFTQYIALFIIGIEAARNRWLDDIPVRTGNACARAALLLAAGTVIFVCLMLGSPGGIGPALGGSLYWQAVFYAFLEQMTGVMIIGALLFVFSTRFNAQGPVTRAMAGDSYTVYVFHPLVVILLALAMAGVAIPSPAKFAIVLPLAIACSFTLAHLIRAVPGVNRVL